MQRAAYVAAIALSALLLIPAHAGAYKPRQLEAAGYAFWGAQLEQVCPDGVKTIKQAPADDDFADAAENTVGWARPGVCELHLSVYREFAGQWVADCAVALHEYGHIIGHTHRFRGRGHIMEGHSTIVRSEGWPEGHPELRRVFWSGTGTYWCQRYERRRAFSRGAVTARVTATLMGSPTF